MLESEAGPHILSIDTTTDVRSVAVSRGAQLLAQRAGSLRGAQAANLLGEIDATLKQAGVKLEQIGLLAVAQGPGSFTGLRSGLATIKAFAATLGRPVVGVPTLHAIAHATGAGAHIVAALTAGRGELFAQLLAVAADGTVQEHNEPTHVPPAVLLKRALTWPTPLRWAGAGAQAQGELLGQAAASAGLAWQVESDQDEPERGAAEQIEARRWTLAQAAGPYALDVAALALQAYRAGRTVGAEGLRALYVRLSDAELNERCRV